MFGRIQILLAFPILLLATALWAQNQPATFGGLGSASGTPSTAYPTLGAVPTFSGQAHQNAQPQSGRGFRNGREHRRGGRHGRHFGRRGFGYGLPYYSPFWYGYYGYGEQCDDCGNYGYESAPPQYQPQANAGSVPYIVTPPESQSQPSRHIQTSEVTFKSSPERADVMVDGYLLGQTPGTFRLPVGQHLVSIQKWGFNAWERKIDVSANESNVVKASLSEGW